jgi:hypothetical protein
VTPTDALDPTGQLGGLARRLEHLGGTGSRRGQMRRRASSTCHVEGELTLRQLNGLASTGQATGPISGPPIDDFDLLLTGAIISPTRMVGSRVPLRCNVARM